MPDHPQQPPEGGPTPPADPQPTAPTAFVQIVFLRPDSWEFEFSVGEQTSVYQLAVALQHLKIMTERAIEMIQKANGRPRSKIMIPRRPI